MLQLLEFERQAFLEPISFSCVAGKAKERSTTARQASKYYRRYIPRKVLAVFIHTHTHSLSYIHKNLRMCMHICIYMLSSYIYISI